MKNKTFTLIEIIISLIIIGILVIIVFKIFTTIGNILIRTENEKNLQTEILYLNQLLENLLDNYSLDYSKYNFLKTTNWLSSWLYLIDENNSKHISIYQTWNCNITNWKDIHIKNCWLEINIDWKTFPLTNTWTTFINNFIFKIIPFEKNPNNFSGIYQPWIGINWTFYIKRYNPFSRPMKVKINYENFYDIKSR